MASFWQWASAPARPPRFAPSPMPTLVMKKDIGGGGAFCAAGCWARRGSAARVRNMVFIVSLMSLLRLGFAVGY